LRETEKDGRRRELKAGAFEVGKGRTMTAKVELTVKNGKLAGRRYKFTGYQECVVGRGDDCGLQLPKDAEFLTASRHHCLLRVDPPVVRVQDLGSHNGTFLNGLQIGRPAGRHLPRWIADIPCGEYELCEGDELKIGETVFAVHIQEEPDSPIGFEEKVPEDQGLYAYV
jgi:pSer/pThr/pTyr-binding forkhead associated (FHA) protein